MKNYKFCQKCGKEVEEGWKNCPNCGESVELTEEEYFQKYGFREPVEQPNKKGKKANTIGVIVLIFASLLILATIYAMLSVPVEKEYHHYDNSEPVTPPPTTTYENTEFITWAKHASNELSDISENFVWATENELYEALRDYADEGVAEIGQYMIECQSFHLSYEYDAIRDEFYEILVDYKQAYEYASIGAQCMIDEDYECVHIYIPKATEYIGKARVHVRNVTQMLEDL